MKHVWTLYAGALLVLALGRMAQKIVTETGGFGSRYGAVILAVIIGAGVLGRVAERPIARRWVWMMVFWLLAVAATGASLLAVAQLFEGSYRMAGLILGIPLLLSPGLWQLFRYGHRSPSVWGGGSEPTS